MDTKGKSQLRKKGLVCLIAIACIQLCSCNFDFWNVGDSVLSKLDVLKDRQEGGGEDIAVQQAIYVIPEKDAKLVVKHDNGDTVYRPEEGSMAFDEEHAEIYYDNLVIAYTFSNLGKDEADELAGKIGGAVIGDISGAVNRLQILVEPTDLETLKHYADILMESAEVLYASYEIPVFISENNTDDEETKKDADKNPWSADGIIISDKNEETPDGSDWWAEAVGAYSAWNYVDSHPAAVSEITVGILDSGFDTGHEDLGNKITMINDNSPTDHGTLVSGIIAAENNTVGLRGIADSAILICADWSQVNIGEDGEQVETEVFSSGEWSELTKQMIEYGAKVINNSWNTALSSPDTYYSDVMDGNSLRTWLLSLLDGVFGTYDSYMEMKNAYSRRTAMESILLIIELQLSGQDFLIVQGAGNGLDNGGNGYDASKGSHYAAISEDLFEMLSETVKDRLKNMGITYDTIRNHIMIVGAAENRTDDEGNYYLCGFSNYGSHVDICAPGEEVFCTLTTLDDENDPDNKQNGLIYDYGRGTSVAAPIVSGAVALVWSLEPSLSSAEVKNILTAEANTSTAVGVTGDDKGTIYRMLNVGRAVESITKTNLSPIDSDSVTWVIEPEYNYQCVVPLRGSSFSDIGGDYSNGQKGIFEDIKDSWFDFYEMSFPSYSNLPQYYKIQLEDGSWRLYFMPDHSDSGDIPIDQGESNQNEYMTRGDASGILNDTAIVESSLEKEKPSRYYYWPHYPYPWYLFTINNRGMGDMDIYYDIRTKQALAVGNFYDTVITPVRDAGLHKPYPSGRINTEKIDIDDVEAMFLAQGTDLFNKYCDLVFPTTEEYPKGYVDTNGQAITDFIYDEAEDFSEGIAACSRNGKWGYINENGEEITDFIYDGVWISKYEMKYNDDLEKYEYFPKEYVSYPCTSDTMVIWLDGQVGLLYRNGQTLIAFGEFEDMAPAYNNELWAKKDGLWGLIDLADAKQKAGVSPTLTVPAADIPDPEYDSYMIEQYPETMSFDYPSRESQIYEFYQDVNEFPNTTAATPMYENPDGGNEIVTIPAGEPVHVYGIIQSKPGWVCVEWSAVVTERTYYGNRYSDQECVIASYFGWVQDEYLSPYSNSVPDSAYQDILQQYRTLCALPGVVWHSDNYNGFYKTEYSEVNIMTAAQIQQGYGNLYFAYYDINRDGQDELLIGRGQLQEREITLEDILTYNSAGIPISFNNYDERGGGYVGDRADVRLCEDGTLVLFYSASGFHGHYQFFNVSDNGYVKTGKEYDQDTRERPDATFFDGSGYITEAEMQAILDEYNYIPNDAFEWNLLAEEKE